MQQPGRVVARCTGWLRVLALRDTDCRERTALGVGGAGEAGSGDGLRGREEEMTRRGRGQEQSRNKLRVTGGLIL